MLHRFILALLAWGSCLTLLFAQQTQFSPGFSWRAYTGTVTAPLCPGKLCTNYPMVSWNDKYQEFAAWKSVSGNPNTASSFLNFRVAFPPGFNKADLTKKYPVILMLHGAGESGRTWQGRYDYEYTDPRIDNNSANLSHGGNEHQIAISKPASDPRSFPGIVVFPQASSSGSWSDGWNNGSLSQNENYLIDFLDYLIAEYNADINHVAIHGLSNGARGVWDISMKRPDLFAAVLPMSGIPYNMDTVAAIHNTTPIRLYQGGLDTNPNPNSGKEVIDRLVAAGGSPQYYLYPTLGHNTWTTAYATADFFSWILAQDKRKIYVFGGSTELCTGATKKLGFSAGFTNYQWLKDGVLIPNETTRYITINSPGVYTVEFKRPNDPNTWHQSFPITITFKAASSFSPLLTNTGSLILRYTNENGGVIGSVNSNSTVLSVAAGLNEYYWYKNGVLVTGNIVNGSGSTVAANTSNTWRISNQAGTAADAGTYHVIVKENSGCLSNLSNTKTMAYNAASSQPFHSYPNQCPGGGTCRSGASFTGVGRPVLTAIAYNKMRVAWTDNTNEEYFEIWRYRLPTFGGYPGGGSTSYTMIATVSANTTTFNDESGLRPGASYVYLVRAIGNNDGRYSQASTSRSLPDETQPPTTPQDLTLTGTTETTLSIQWTPSIDNDVVYSYEVFRGETLVGTVINDITGDYSDGNPPPPTFYTFTGLDPATTYQLNVRATDFRGNKSAFPEAITATTAAPSNGVAFKYYTVAVNLPNTLPINSQLAEPPVSGSFNFSTQTPAQTGVISNFVINGAYVFQNEPFPTGNPGRFIYAYDSYIQIDVTGTYTFFTRSDEGSRLYINGTLVVNNDGIHTVRNRTGTYTFNATGKFPIRVTYFDNSSLQSLGVKYRQGTFLSTSDANYNAASFIPNNKLWLSGVTFTNYYSKANGNLDNLATWGTNTDGSGVAPINFTNNYQFFTIANRSSATLSNAWTVSGTSSRVIVGSNVTLTLNAAMNAKLYANAGSVINLNNITLPQFVELNPTSTVNMNVNGTISAAVYGNLNLKTGATTKTLPTNGASIKGNLVVDDQVVLLGTAINQSSLIVYGNITFNGSSGNPPLAKDRYSLIMKGSNPHTIDVNQYDLFLQSLELDFGSILDVNFNTSSTKSITVGATGLSGGLLLHTGSTFQVGQNNLTVLGSYGLNPTDDSGEISISGGDVTVTTNSVQTSNLFFSDESIIKNLSFNLSGSGQLNVMNKASLKNLMTLSAGTANMFGNFILNSDVTGTARIGPLGTGSRINGAVTFRRFMEGEGQIYRYISSPVKGFRVADMQQYIPVTGTFTGTNGTIPSMFYYQTNAYQNFPQTNGTNQDTLRRGRGYVIFVREAVAPTTWEATGNPHQGTIPFTLTAGTGSPTDGWNLLGNPYPAPIQWTGVQGGAWSSFQNVSQTVYIRENFIASNGTRQYKFRVYNPNTPPSASDYTPFDGVIAPGQAFWVQTASSPSLTITETAKQTTDRSFFRSGDDLKKDVLSVLLKKGDLSDIAYLLYTDSSTENYDKITDAVKMDNSYFNLSTLSKDNIALAINATPETFCEKEIRLNITNAPAGNYSLIFQGIESFKHLAKMQLKDNFLGTFIEISPDLTYNFAVTTNPASTGKSRFVIFEKPILKSHVSLAINPVCESDPTLLINDAQPGANYQAFFNGLAVSEKVRATGDSTTVTLDKKLLGIGTHPITLMVSYGACIDMVQNQLEKIQIDSLNTPAINLSSGLLITNITQADKYQWYLDGAVLKEETSASLTPIFGGIYEVEVTSNSCVKKSPGFTYSVTAIDDFEKPEVGIYPNPFNDKLMVTLEEADDVTSIITLNLMGQTLKQVPVSSKREIELDLSDLPSGTYIISVGIRKYKVIKQ